MYILPDDVVDDDDDDDDDDDATRIKICRILQSFNVTLLCKYKYCAFVSKLL
jgi:hypothetical protein